MIPIRLVHYSPDAPGLLCRFEPLARQRQLKGFGRATSDDFSREVLWDIVVAGNLQGHGLNRQVIEKLLHTPLVVGIKWLNQMIPKPAFIANWVYRMCPPQQLIVLCR